MHLDAVSSLQDWKKYIHEMPARFDPNMEYAFGESPMYSVSKALLNVLTRVIHKESPAGCHLRVVSVCPGNVISPMSTEEEKLTAIPAEDAAADILAVALGSTEEFPGGRFYRFREPISW
jgi:NAD(P)-dependent dehydrogenase (short-subunit alcohol dehydrogenase family)